MFTEDDRAGVLDRLIAAARADGSVVGAATVGSLAAGTADRWSDIDLALRLAPGREPVVVAESWTTWLGTVTTVADHLDVWAGPALYRVFLLADTLQVDLSFWPFEDFGTTGEPFQIVFGGAGRSHPAEAADVAALTGWAWLFALHARSAIARGRPWQALQMIDDLRGRLVALACIRHGLPPHHGRGVDRLPEAERSALSAAVPTGLDSGSLMRAFDAAVRLLQQEAIDEPSVEQAERLRSALDRLRSSVQPGADPGSSDGAPPSTRGS